LSFLLCSVQAFSVLCFCYFFHSSGGRVFLHFTTGHVQRGGHGMAWHGISNNPFSFSLSGLVLDQIHHGWSQMDGEVCMVYYTRGACFWIFGVLDMKWLQCSNKINRSTEILSFSLTPKNSPTKTRHSNLSQGQSAYQQTVIFSLMDGLGGSGGQGLS
jgi:hypothetical protein